MDETDSDTDSEKLEKNNFYGKRHELTPEDRVKGGQTVTPKKALANSFRSVTSGKYSKFVPHCHTCSFKNQCGSYDAKDPKAICKIIDIPNHLELIRALHFNSEEEFDGFINRMAQRMHLKTLTSQNFSEMKDFIMVVLAVKNSKFRTPKEQTINLQINNFSTEFQLFKDVTIRVLSKHPEVMQEWRAALESAKQSN